MKKLKLKTGAWLGTEEWLISEEASFEDHNNAKDHVFAILQREHEKNYMELTRKEALILFESIKYHAFSGRDVWDSPQEERAIKSTYKGYYRRLKRLLND